LVFPGFIYCQCLGLSSGCKQGVRTLSPKRQRFTYLSQHRGGREPRYVFHCRAVGPNNSPMLASHSMLLQHYAIPLHVLLKTKLSGLEKPCRLYVRGPLTDPFLWEWELRDFIRRESRIHRVLELSISPESSRSPKFDVFCSID
jgi:hypothetical protein